MNQLTTRGRFPKQLHLVAVEKVARSISPAIGINNMESELKPLFKPLSQNSFVPDSGQCASATFGARKRFPNRPLPGLRFGDLFCSGLEPEIEDPLEPLKNEETWDFPLVIGASPTAPVYPLDHATLFGLKTE